MAPLIVTRPARNRIDSRQDRGLPSRGIIAAMPDLTRTRMEIVDWKKQSLVRVQETISVIKELKRSLNKTCDGTHSVISQIRGRAEKLGKKVESLVGALDENLDEDTLEEDSEDDVEEDSEDDVDDVDKIVDAADGLQQIPDVADEAEDTKLQAGDSIDTLLTRLEEVRDQISGIKP